MSTIESSKSNITPGAPELMHLYGQFGIVGRPRHLVALVRAPRGKLDAPIAGGGGVQGRILRRVAGLGALERAQALCSRARAAAEQIRHAADGKNRQSPARGPQG